jgi:hypothetical protein
MRSDLVFSAARTIGNRFRLCRVLFAGTVRLHNTGNDFAESINSALTLVGSSNKSEEEWMASASGDYAVPGSAELQAAEASL